MTPALRSDRRVPIVNEGAVATKATLRAAERLGLSNKVLAAVVGVSEATVSRMGAGTYQLSPGDKSFELGLLFVRLFRSLDASSTATRRSPRHGCARRTLRCARRPSLSFRPLPGSCMSLATWTPAALSRERRPLSGTCWRAVESQHRVSTMKLVDTLEEQAALEALLEPSKPPVPDECRHLDFLLFTPFRYGAPYPTGSRSRRRVHARRVLRFGGAGNGDGGNGLPSPALLRGRARPALAAQRR